MSTKTLTVGAGIVMVFITLVSLFVGGFVVARTTVGENKLESIIYGLLLWGVLLVFFLVMGGALGMGLGGCRGSIPFSTGGVNQPVHECR